MVSARVPSHFKRSLQPDKATDDNKLRRMRFACQIIEAADTEDLGVCRSHARFYFFLRGSRNPAIFCNITQLG